MSERLGLTPDQMVRNSEQRMRGSYTDRIADLRSDGFNALCHREQATEIASSAMIHVHPVQEPDLIKAVIEPLRDLDSSGQGSVHLLAVAFGEHQRMPQRALQLDFACGAARLAVEECKRSFCPAATLVQQRHFDQ